jgi:hypothetical protein
MLVRSYGFSLVAGNKEISTEDLFSYLVSISGAENDSLGNLRKVFVDGSGNDGLLRGLVVTVKDQKTFCELQNNQGSFVISVANLKGKNKLMEFNFFIINKKNGLGIYQHYFQSCAPATFGRYLSSYYRYLSDSSKNRKIKELDDNGELSGKKERLIKSSHAKGLYFSILVHKESLEKVLSKFNQIKAMEYEYAQLEPDLIKGAPLATYVNRIRQKVTFKKDSKIDVLAKAIQQTVNKFNFRSGRVSVVDSFGDEDIPMSVKIANIPEHFGEEDYDTVAGLLNNLDVKKFSSHKVMLSLVEKMTVEYKHIFMKNVKDKN